MKRGDAKTFEAFQELAGNGSHLYVVGAHDGVPAGSGGTEDVTRRWFDHHLRGVEDDADHAARGPR